jgi:NADH-quinone oxidoreductase subunit E
VGLLLEIVVFLIIAAALGFAVGWLVRGGGLLAEQTSLDNGSAARPAPGAARLAELEHELAAAHKANARHRAEIGRLETRVAELEESARTATKESARAPAAAVDAVAEAPGTAPPALAGPEGDPDDLQQISGIGPGLERTLHGLGIFHFRQIAAFTPENVAWVNQRLRFRGRIEREDWIGQAKRLASGGQPLQ